MLVKKEEKININQTNTRTQTNRNMYTSIVTSHDLYMFNECRQLRLA